MVSAVAPSPFAVRVKSAVFRSDLGRAKKTNEDGVLSLNKIPLYAVADGTGGPEPARVALMTLKEQVGLLTAKNADAAASGNTTNRLGVGRCLEALFSKANTAVFEAAEQIQDRRIATTLCALTIAGPHAFVAHVGDSRAYHYRQGNLRCLTNDHTLAALQLRRGDITESEFEHSPFRRTLAQAVGMSPALEVDLMELRLMGGDILLVTSNGLNRALSDEVIAACVGADGDADSRADLLVRKVGEAGAPDNTTFVLIEIEAPQRPRVRPEDLEAVARRSMLFIDLNDTEWHQVQPYLEVIDAQPGELVCRMGDEAIGFAVVTHGRLRVEQAAGEVREIFPGGNFGALALANEEKAAETVTALELSQLMVLSKARLAEIVRLSPVLGGKLTLSLLEALGNRLGVLTTRLGQILDAANGKL